jgi:hypothetical protein
VFDSLVRHFASVILNGRYQKILSDQGRSIQ